MFGSGALQAVFLIPAIIFVFLLIILTILMPIFVWRIKQCNEKLVEEAIKTRRQTELLADALAENQAKLHRAIDIFASKS